jgi:hypothetical protein
MNDTVPIVVPVRVNRDSVALSVNPGVARPKSRIFGVPSDAMMMLAGLRSRWTMPWAWARASALAI